MARRVRILGFIVVLLAIPVVALALYASHDSACAPSTLLPADARVMKAIVSRCYGPPDVVLRLEDIEKPTAGADQVLVRVRAAAVNPLDWHQVRGTPYLMLRRENGFGAPTESRIGVDYAGTVEAVGPEVKEFKPGDEVFGARTGAFAEYVIVRESRQIVHKPPNISFEQAAAVEVAGVTALQALRNWGHLKAGDKVLINGASGGVGSFAVQIAKAYGAEVTGVCSTGNVELVRKIGADYVIDYKKEDFTEAGKLYDLIVDMAGNHSLFELRHVLQPEGRVVVVGTAESGKWFGSLIEPLKADLLNRFVSQEFTRMRTDLNKADLIVLRDLLQEGKLVPQIDRQYKLSEVPAAIAYVETGHARGKVIILVD